MTKQAQEFSCAHEALTPPMRNRPGLSEISYRAGTHPVFLDNMLTALSRDPNLKRLTTRAVTDPAISLIDSWAVVLDILTFYNERIANEGWLRTALTRQSIQELARQVGYQLNPGVSAHTYLAFTVQPSPAGGDVYPMEAGLKVQSIPGPDETPQIFETSQRLNARPEFNEIAPLQAERQIFGRRTVSAWLAGTDTRLEPGMTILLVGPARQEDPGSERWEMRTVHTVFADDANNRTRITWREDLGHFNPGTEPETDPEIFTFDLRANLFGHNAPDARTIPADIPTRTALITGDEWTGFSIADPSSRRIDLDAEYEEFLPESWVVLQQGALRELYRVERVVTTSRTDFTLTAKTTRLRLDTDESLDQFGLRGTVVMGASRHLPWVDAPVETPIWGETLVLAQDNPALEEGQLMILRGRPLVAAKVAPRSHVFRTSATTQEGADAPLIFVPNEPGGSPVTLADDQYLQLLAPAELEPSGATIWPVALQDGTEGHVTAQMGADLVPLAPEPPEDAFAPPDEALYASELVEIRRIDRLPDVQTALTLAKPLSGLYWRPSVRLNGNVVAATHGETRYELTSALTGQRFTETLGSGDASQVMQSFRLSQKPLTYTQSSDPSGGTSSLVIRVDGVAWEEVNTLYGQAPDARVYATELGADGHLMVRFGDGRFGARIPAGQGNVVATYRVGIGLSGLVRARQLSLAMDQPLGLDSVINPLPATGAQDPERLEDARANAPLTVLTLDRVVSIRDFEDFARAFAGISKAQATPVWSGEQQIVHITAVGSAGAQLTAQDTTLINLRDAIDGARHSERPVELAGHSERRFGARMRVAVESGVEVAPVLSALRVRLLDRYGLDGQALAQGVEASDLIAVAQSVPWVAAVVLTELDGQLPSETTRLTALRGRWDTDLNTFLPAELLLIDDALLQIEEITP